MSNQRPLEFTEVQEWLMTNLYIVRRNGKFALTDRFHQASKEHKPSGTEIAVMNHGEVGQVVVDWGTRFMEFIAQCQVPAKIPDARGGLYAGNKFNNDAAAEWRKMLELEGINEQVLVLSTMLYYKSNLKYKKAIGNYILQGDWRTDYTEMLKAGNEGHINEHIKTRTDGGEHSGWKLG